MTLYREAPGPFPAWAGEPIDGVRYPRDIEQHWSASDLEAIGLWRDDMIAPAGEVPEDKVSTGRTVERVNGVVTFVHALVDAPYPTADDVVAERSRRLSAGFDFDFGDERGVHHIGTTEQDQAGWTEVTQIALVRSATGSTAPISIITDSGPVEVSPLEWLSVLEAAAAFRQPIWQASFLLQAMSPIPRDFADGAYWP